MKNFRDQLTEFRVTAINDPTSVFRETEDGDYAEENVLLQQYINYIIQLATTQTVTPKEFAEKLDMISRELRERLTKTAYKKLLRIFNQIKLHI